MNKEVENSLNEAIETINNGIEKSDIDYSVVRSLISYAIWKLRKEDADYDKIAVEISIALENGDSRWGKKIQCLIDKASKIA